MTGKAGGNASPTRRAVAHSAPVEGLARWDIALFRWINRDLANPVLDDVMHGLSANRYFVPGLVVLAIWLLWKAGPRGLAFIVIAGATAGLANELLVEPLKATVLRPRPYVGLEDVFLRVGKGNPLGSMPSSHALNIAVLAATAGWFFPRSLWIGAPVALGVMISRVYNGAHYPSDVLAGASLGVASVALVLLAADQGWRWARRRWPTLQRTGIESIVRPPNRWGAGATRSGGAA